MGRWSSNIDANSYIRERIIVSDDGCWEWQKLRNKLGYGRCYFRGKYEFSHRVAYKYLVGPIPEGLILDHLCRNSSCCNPEHLEPVTYAENNRRARSLITHCPQGHAYDERNTHVGSGSRRCRACDADRQRAKRRRVREAAL